ncbi:rhodanese-like domain-containing protein [Hydrogenimonas cancrithermarum]|uniref:Rhodanese-like domain-containing protein n=1 Tax=Hydrogenimonas cancrithermarum TaxID=2993563 RepID=A0ABM8FM86_9BACT|nr:rhodanese-like domain-containing protein [Hydrogenimonas cancrithermarum]BDY12624.1 rhodanese-like domain-containing protein [Hydrogenimonas cancrithermarum]
MKRTMMIALVAGAAVLLYFLYAKGIIFANFESVTPKRAYEMIQNDPDVVILDVRRPEEYREGHLEGARLIPVQELDRRLADLEMLKHKTILVYCRSGIRSVMASRKLAANGFKPYNLKGGINAWKNEGLPLAN